MLKQLRSNEDQNIIERGFTLVELLIVIVILGILAGIVVFAVGNLTSSAKSNACATEKSTIVTAAESYKSQTGSYPADGPGAVTAMDYLTGLNGATVPASVGVLLKSAPADYTLGSGTGTPVAIAGNAGGCT